MLPAPPCNCTVHNRLISRQSFQLPLPRLYKICGLAATAAGVPSTAADCRNQVSPPEAETHNSNSHGRPRKYLTFDEYVALQQRYKEHKQAAVPQQQALGTGTGNVAAAAEASQTSEEHNGAEPGPKKRVPWNKGRKHSALTIARIVSGNARARERPEVKAKLDAWNKSRVGVSLPEEVREKIRQSGYKARMRRLQNTTPEELEARRAAMSERSKQLWQDPQYAEKTTGALRAAVERRRGRRPSSSSSSSSSSAVVEDAGPTRPRTSKRTAPVEASSIRVDEAGNEQQQQQQQLPETKKLQPAKPKQPTKKELAAAAAAAAAAQRQQLQGQVDRLLQMQQLIATSERTVRDLQHNLQAFENNPQAYQIASNTMQQAQVHLGTLRARVHSLHQGLQQQGVVWNSSTGLITHIPGLVEPTSSSSSKRSSSGGSTAGARKGSSKSKSIGNGSSSLPADVVCSSRRDKRGAGSGSPAKADGVVRSARRQAAAAAASSGGSRRNSSSSAAIWEVTPSSQALNGASGVNGNAAARAATSGPNGKHHVNGCNGHSRSGAADGSTFVAVKVEEDVLLGEDTL